MPEDSTEESGRNHPDTRIPILPLGLLRMSMVCVREQR